MRTDAKPETCPLYRSGRFKVPVYLESCHCQPKNLANKNVCVLPATAPVSGRTDTDVDTTRDYLTKGIGSAQDNNEKHERGEPFSSFRCY